MINREDFQEKYSKLSTNQLLEIIDNKGDYIELAYIIALDEFEKRGISETEIDKYRVEQTQHLKTFINNNIYNDLSFTQKNLFYFLWLPFLSFAFKINFRQYGYSLKLKQANYYSLLGFFYFILAGFASAMFNLSILPVFAIWIAGFIPANLLDEYFNRRKLIKRLNKTFGGTENDTTP